MYPTWDQVKRLVEAQMHHDPQRATLASRSIRAVEDGLAQLRSQGFSFVPVDTGWVASLEPAPELEMDIHLPPVDKVVKKFDSMVKEI